MSDIPQARSYLRLARREHDVTTIKAIIGKALRLMMRERPKFIVQRDVKRPLSPRERKRARIMRYRHRMSIRAISIRLRTNSGRISEAVNPERRKNGNGRFAH